MVSKGVHGWAASHCPDCGALMDGAVSAFDDEPERPRAGDLGVCTLCGALVQFDRGLRLRRLTNLSGLSTEDLLGLLAMQEAVRERHRLH